jgi:hypothetical protein
MGLGGGLVRAVQNIDIRLPASRITYIIGAFLLMSGILVTCLGSGISCAIDRREAIGEQTAMDILDDTMAYIRVHHPDAAAFLADDISFTASYTEKYRQGYTGVTYTGGGWTISIGRTITPEAMDSYGIRAEYSNGKIVWVGRSKNGQLTEESYTKSD